MAPQVENAMLPPGCLILVTAGNGYLGSHIVDQCLEYGYAVRTTVRSLERSAWMKKDFPKRHPNSQLEVVEIADLSMPGCYNSVLKGVSAMIHTPGFTNMSDPDMVGNTVKLTMNALKAVNEANKNGEKIQRFVLTGSSWAVQYPVPNVPGDITEDQYDRSIAKALSNPDTPKDFWPILGYVQSKIAGEQACWKYVKENPECGFVLNTVIPATCMGPVIAPAEQQYPSTAGFIRSLHECQGQQLFDVIEPQWYVDVRDQARLHVAGAVLDGVEHRRIFAWAGPYTWIGVADVLEEEMGKRTTIRLADKGEDITKVLAKQKAEGYLKRLGQSDWVPFDQSVRECIRSYYPKA
ncbi:NAD(P)-binding protein [Bimuria novae-zelandiae CBS 107.79]|uniref:NAD(P)-binding protein n=1 Tax=Bimuria novae-zelandiae CBS 107.79 TaxID=1447943 RepID=A0A6A5US05_9PLEO|nr:NAD(P)-binding protein [Bimuria novae-zelandiae CBS 107.79]